MEPSGNVGVLRFFFATLVNFLTLNVTSGVDPFATVVTDRSGAYQSPSKRFASLEWHLFTVPPRRPRRGTPFTGGIDYLTARTAGGTQDPSRIDGGFSVGQ